MNSIEESIPLGPKLDFYRIHILNEQNQNQTCEYSKIRSRLVNKFSAWHENLTNTWAFPSRVKHLESVKPIAEGDKLNKSIKVSLFDR